MSLKLIRKAQIATTTNKDLLVAEHVRTVLESMGLDGSNIKESVESAGPDLAIAKADYDRWMGAVHDVARESGMTIKQKTHLADIAMSVLDNDPKIESQPGDKEELKNRIINTMWNAHKATLGHVGVQKHVQKAHEDEEMSEFAHNFRTAQGVEDEQVSRKPTLRASSIMKGAVGSGQKNPFPPGSFRHDLWAKMHPEENEEFDGSEFSGAESGGEMSSDDFPRPEANGEVSADVNDREHHTDADDAVAGADEVNDDDIAAVNNDEDDYAQEDPEEVLAEIPTEELEAELERRKGDEGDDETPHDDVEVDTPNADVDVEEKEPKVPANDDEHADEEPVEDVARRVYDEEEQSKSIFHSVITRPTEHLKSALQDIEKEAEEAWHSIKLPKNPYQKKSPAFKSWEKRFRDVAKAGLGIKDPKPVATSKQRRR